jgi:hypothetical protein
MATEDLGTIDAGAITSAPDPSSVDVLGGLVEGIGVAAEGIKSAVLQGEEGKRQDIAEEELETAKAADPRNIVADPESLTGDPVADGLLKNIATLEAQRDAASGSSRLNAERRLRAANQQLTQQFPGLADEMATDMRRFMFMDPEFQELAAIDARNAAFNAQTQEQLDEIREFAYKPVSSGGLGLIPGRNPFGSVGFAKKWAAAAVRVEDANAKQVALEHSRISSDLSIRDKAATFSSWLDGNSGRLRLELDEARAASLEVANASANITGEGNAAIVANWEGAGGRRQQVLEEVAVERANLITEFGSYFSAQDRTSSEFAGVKAQFEQELAAMDNLIAGVSKDDWNLVKAYSAYDTYKTIEIEQAAPEAFQLGRFFDNMDKVFEHGGDNFGNMDALLKNEISEWSIDALKDGFWGIMHSLGTDVATEDPQAYDAELRRRATRNPDPAQTGNNTAESRRTQGYQLLGLSSTDNVMTAAELADRTTPDNAAALTTGRTVGLMMVFDHEPSSVPEDLAREVSSALTHPGVLKQAMLAPNKDRMALGRQVTELIAGQQANRTRDYNNRKLGAVSGTNGQLPLLNILELDVESISTGKPVFEVNEEKLNRELQRLLLTPERGQVAAIRDARQDAKDKAMALSARVAEDLKLQATRDSLMFGDDINYERAWENGRYFASFPVPTDAVQ